MHLFLSALFLLCLTGHPVNQSYSYKKDFFIVENTESTKSLDEVKDITNSSTYTETRLKIKESLIKAAGRFDDSLGEHLSKIMSDNIFPYWYGTAWDYNGITEIPGSGKIACGYFVSTTLKHVGFNLNRYKLSQLYSHAIVKTLCKDLYIYHSVEKVVSHLMLSEDRLYVVGLDNHVGFLLKEGEDIYFIHSTYLSPGCVVKERAEVSAALNTSSKYVLGNLSGNDEILKKWVKGEVIGLKH